MSVTVSSGETYNVSSAQTDNGDTVLSGGSMFVLSGGYAQETIVESGGSLTVSSGGADNATTISSGGFLTIDGVSNYTILYGGSEIVFGVADDAEVFAAGTQTVTSGGMATGTMISDGGVQYVGYLGGTGTATDTTVSDEGTQYVGFDRRCLPRKTSNYG